MPKSTKNATESSKKGSKKVTKETTPEPTLESKQKATKTDKKSTEEKASKESISTRKPTGVDIEFMNKETDLYEKKIELLKWSQEKWKNDEDFQEQLKDAVIQLLMY